MDVRPAHVVLLHGQPGAGSDWDGVVDHLPTGLTTLALDRPGYRSSPLPPGSLEANAQWLLGELDRAEIGEAILVGHSYGGGVVLTTAKLAPQRVCGLVLVASVGPGCLDGWDHLLAAPVAGEICALTAWWLTPWFARRRLEHLERMSDRALRPDEYVNLEVWANARHHHGAMWRTFLSEQRELVRGLDALTDALPGIKTPTLVMADPADSMIGVGTARQLQAQLPHASLQLVDRGGHNLPRRIPAEVAAGIARLAAELSS